jgi:hypothetical protein
MWVRDCQHRLRTCDRARVNGRCLESQWNVSLCTDCGSTCDRARVNGMCLSAPTVDVRPCESQWNVSRECLSAPTVGPRATVRESMECVSRVNGMCLSAPTVGPRATVRESMECVSLCMHEAANVIIVQLAHGAQDASVGDAVGDAVGPSQECSRGPHGSGHDGELHRVTHCEPNSTANGTWPHCHQARLMRETNQRSREHAQCMHACTHCCCVIFITALMDLRLSRDSPCRMNKHLILSSWWRVPGGTVERITHTLTTHTAPRSVKR